MGIVGWIKQNVIGDFAEARREYEAKERVKNPTPESKGEKTRSFKTRDFSLGIVGESHYQKTLTNAKRNSKDYGGISYINAVLSLEPENQYDQNAIVVATEQSETIGYLSRDDAKRYQGGIQSMGLNRQVYQMPSEARGWRRPQEANWCLVGSRCSRSDRRHIP